jgi:hypothetical protein
VDPEGIDILAILGTRKDSEVEQVNTEELELPKTAV